MIMKYYPIFLKLTNKRVLVVGGGKVALRKIEALLKCGAIVNIVAKYLDSRLKELISLGNISYLGENFRDQYLNQIFLVIAATNDADLNSDVSKCAKKRGIPVNEVDKPLDCDFILPSVINRGDLTIAISTSGQSPALAKKIRKDIAKKFGKEYKTYLVLLGYLRQEILKLGLPQEENSKIFKRIVDSEIYEALSIEDWKQIEITFHEILPQELDSGNLIKAFNQD